MALSIDFNICLDSACSNFTFTEITGAYSATNTTGWGAPNPVTGDITIAYLQVIAPDGTITTIPLLPESFPSSNPSFEFEFTTTSVGGYEDGQWTFLLYYSDGETVYMKKHVKLFYCDTKCCIDTMLANIDLTDCDCGCQDEAIDTYLKARIFLDGLKNAARCNQVANFTSIKAILDKICINKGCKTCN